MRESLGRLVAEMEQDPNPLDMIPELHQSRAIYAEYLRRCELPIEDPQHLNFKPEAAQQFLTEISKIVKRIEDVRAKNAVSRRDLMRVITEMGRIVDTLVQDPKTKEQIRKQWLRIKVA